MNISKFAKLNSWKHKDSKKWEVERMTKSIVETCKLGLQRIKTNWQIRNSFRGNMLRLSYQTLNVTLFKEWLISVCFAGHRICTLEPILFPKFITKFMQTWQVIKRILNLSMTILVSQCVILPLSTNKVLLRSLIRDKNSRKRNLERRRRHRMPRIVGKKRETLLEKGRDLMNYEGRLWTASRHQPNRRTILPSWKYMMYVIQLQPTMALFWLVDLSENSSFLSLVCLITYWQIPNIKTSSSLMKWWSSFFLICLIMMIFLMEFAHWPLINQLRSWPKEET